jgi:hypothetical protein
MIETSMNCMHIYPLMSNTVGGGPTAPVPADGIDWV